jgi:hypothetical protein
MGCGLGAKVVYCSSRFKVTARAREKSGGTLILRAGLARRTSAELSREHMLPSEKAAAGSGRAQMGSSTAGTGVRWVRNGAVRGLGQFAPSVKMQFGAPTCRAAAYARQGRRDAIGI